MFVQMGLGGENGRETLGIVEAHTWNLEGG